MENEILAATSKLYDASINQAHWVEALDRIAPMIGAKGSALLLLETLGQYSYSINQSSSIYPEHLKKIYVEEYSIHEQVNFNNIANSTPGEIIIDADYTDDPIKFRSRPDVKFILDNIGVFERFGVRLNVEKAWFDCITFQYDDSRGNINLKEKQVLKQFLPHIAKATEMSRVYALLRERYNAVLSVLDKFKLGVFIVLPSSEAVLKNKTADKILAQRDGIYVSNSGVLKTNNESSLLNLNRAIQNAANVAKILKAGFSTKILVPKLSGVGEFYLDISPLNDTDNEIDMGLSGALVTVIDTEANEIIMTDGVAELYNLSKTEAIICDMLAQGKKYREMADIRGVSQETIKTQVNSVFRKTGCNSRSELFSRILKINLPIA